MASQLATTAGGALSGAAVGTAILPGVGTAVGAVAGGALGYLSGSGEEESAQTAWSQSINLGKMSGRERSANQGVTSSYNMFGQLVNAGPGISDVRASRASNNDLSAMLERYKMEGGADPTAGDISRAGSLSDQLFAAQRIQMGQAFEDQTTGANRQAALMGRSINDPILKAKLAQEQTRQSAVLGAQQGSFATQYAMQQPMQRLGFQQQLTDFRGGLASQAMANRQALMAAGQTIQSNERNWRLQKADKSGTGSSQAAPLGFTGAMTQGLALGSMGMDMYSKFGGNQGYNYNTGGGGMQPGALSGMNFNQTPSNMYGVSNGQNLMSLYGGAR
jgi:hypothetical protein